MRAGLFLPRHLQRVVVRVAAVGDQVDVGVVVQRTVVVRGKAIAFADLFDGT